MAGVEGGNDGQKNRRRRRDSRPFQTNIKRALANARQSTYNEGAEPPRAKSAVGQESDVYSLILANAAIRNMAETGRI